MRRPAGDGTRVPDGGTAHVRGHGPKDSPAFFSVLVALPALCLSGCSGSPLLDPRGPIGKSELHIIGVAFALMLIVVIPVTVMAIWFPHRYRASRPQDDYAPKWSRSARIDAIVWLVPALIVLVLGILTWRQTHRLDPFRPIAGDARPIPIQVVSLDWKWLFIYPQQGIATVNRLVIPAHVPISFRLTSDSVMTSFFIPRLGSQIYAMAGRRTRLHLLADTPGVYRGQNQQFSGRGYADMHFRVRVTTGKQFAAWVRQTRKRAPHQLDVARFAALSEPGVRVTETAFAPVSPGLFDAVVDRFRQPAAGH
jgi:cytochrome o ubiquinol oxidase subunit 2